jgi:hypothetical protein
MTSFDGILREMRPWMRMTVPKGLRRLDGEALVPGQPLFRSRLYVFEFIPFGHTDLTLLELTDGRGFVEQSSMTGMKLWRHERWLEPGENGCTLTDRLTFEPRFAAPIVAWYVRRVFTHRHAVLRRIK